MVKCPGWIYDQGSDTCGTTAAVRLVCLEGEGLSSIQMKWGGRVCWWGGGLGLCVSDTEVSGPVNL